MNEQFVKKSRYRTASGVMLIIFLCLFFAGLLVFVGFFVYYSVTIKFGDTDKLMREFAQTQTDDSSVKNLFGGLARVERQEQFVRQHNAAIGAKGSPVTILEFVDFKCPNSRDAYQAIKSVAQKYESVVRVIFKHLPMEELYPDSKVVAIVAACAKEQGRFWEYHDLLFERTEFDLASLVGYAQEIGLNIEKFNLCLVDDRVEKYVEQDMLDAAQLGLKGTPTYIINGYKIEGALTTEMWDRVILEILQRQ